VVLCFIVFLCASPSSELVVFDPGKALFVYIGLHPELFRLIKVYINYRSNPARNRSDPPIRHKRTRPKWLYRTRSEGLTGYSCLSVLLPLRVRLGHLSWNNSGGSATHKLSVVIVLVEYLKLLYNLEAYFMQIDGTLNKLTTVSW
jgi:hypothetical protein